MVEERPGFFSRSSDARVAGLGRPAALPASEEVSPGAGALGLLELAMSWAARASAGLNRRDISVRSRSGLATSLAKFWISGRRSTWLRASSGVFRTAVHVPSFGAVGLGRGERALEVLEAESCSPGRSE